jgi:hypothetical protein
VPEGEPAELVAALVGVGVAEAGKLLDEWTTRAHPPLTPGTTAAVLRRTLVHCRSAGDVGRELGVEESVVLAIANGALAHRWKLDEARLAEITWLALWARRARTEMGYDPPMQRGPGHKRPHGAWTAAQPGTLPRGRELLRKVAAALKRLATARREAAAALNEALYDSAAWDPLVAKARAQEGDDRAVYEVAALVEDEDQGALVARVSAWAREALPAGAKPKPSATAGWEADAAALAARLCREHKWPITTNHGEDGARTAWQEFAGAWLRLLGVGRGVEALVRHPPPLERFADLWAEVHPPHFNMAAAGQLVLDSDMEVD